jgi:hypothetical protein
MSALRFPRQGTAGGPYDVDLADLLEKARRRGVKVWQADKDGQLVEITTTEGDEEAAS